MSLSIIQTADQGIYDPPQRLLAPPPRGRRMVRRHAPGPITTPVHASQSIARRSYPTDCCCNMVDTVAGPPYWLGRQGPDLRLSDPPNPIVGTCSGINFMQPRYGRAQEERGLHIPSPPPPDTRWWRGWVRWLLGI